MERPESPPILLSSSPPPLAEATDPALTSPSHTPPPATVSTSPPELTIHTSSETRVKRTRKLSRDHSFKRKKAETPEQTHQIPDVPSRKVKLDVGGHLFATTTTTLVSEPDSMLGAMFSGKYDTQPDDDGTIFIDRDGTYFQHILNYLRNKKVPAGLSADVLDSLAIEAEYYQLRGLQAAVMQKKRDAEVERSVFNAETKVITIVNGWSSFPGINIETAQHRIQHAIDEQEREGWMFVSSTTEACKARTDPGTNVTTNVNLVHLFFKNKSGQPKTLIEVSE